jgi:hypothetical protein
MGGSSQPFGGTRSTFGDQSSSRRRSAPSFGFGSGTREGREKVFVSQEHAAVSSGGTRSPGPAVYTQKSAVGGQVSSSARSAPQWAFGTSQRWMTNAKSAGSVPGPGTYDLHAGVGTQVSSKQSSAPLYGFGSSTRDHQEKVFIAEEHNKSLYGTGSPGPMMYNLPSSVGKQVRLPRRRPRPRRPRRPRRAGGAAATQGRGGSGGASPHQRAPLPSPYACTFPSLGWEGSSLTAKTPADRFSHPLRSPLLCRCPPPPLPSLPCACLSLAPAAP